MTWEDFTSVVLPVLAIVGLFGIGYLREQRTRAGFRAFAQRHGLHFHEEQLIKGVSAHGEGKYRGQDLYVGYTWVKPFTPGIGPVFGGKAVAVVALTIGSTDRIDRRAPVVEEFLKGTGTLSEKSVCYSFPRRYVRAISREELEAAFAVVRQVAATETR